MNTNQPRHPRTHTLPSLGFTLLEMVIVLGIIAVLLGSAVGLLKGIPKAAAMQRAGADFNAVGAALKAYKITAGEYPTTSQGLQALVTSPGKSPKWVKLMDKLPTDPWGTTFSYKFPGTKDKNEFELISAGPDQQLGTPDDLSSQDP